jgi:hypothetical protein
MRNTRIIALSLPNEIITELKRAYRSNPKKFKNLSNTSTYMLTTGLSEWKSGKQLVEFVDKLFGE